MKRYEVCVQSNEVYVAKIREWNGLVKGEEMFASATEFDGTGTVRKFGNLEEAQKFLNGGGFDCRVLSGACGRYLFFKNYLLNEIEEDEDEEAISNDCVDTKTLSLTEAYEFCNQDEEDE